MNRETLKVIDQYEILDVIGRGGMSTVYKALDTQLQRLVALKVMHPHLADKPDFRSRFLAEGRAIAGLSHPNIVHVYDVALSEENQLFLVMEYLAGGTLRKRLNYWIGAGKLLDLREIITITRQVAQALDYAHTCGVLHRDVKPDNVLLKLDDEINADEPMPNVQALLTDFGLAKRIDAGTSITATDELIGTLAYMAPERFRGDPLYDGSSDIYSLGVMLYELVTGRQPFLSNSMVEMILMHTQGEPERIQDLRPDTPASLVSIIHRTMLKNPDDRYNDAGEIGRELEALEKSLRAAQGFALAVQKSVTHPNAQVDDDGQHTLFDVLPSLDRPAIPVDLFSEGSGDVIIVTPLDGPSWSMPLEKPSVTVGRSAICDLQLDDLHVSRRHLRVDRLSDGQIILADLGSHNGVFLGDVKLEKNAITAWGASQSVKVGPYWLTLRPAKVPRRATLSTVRSIAAVFGDNEANIRLLPSESYVEPGGEVTIRLEVTNRCDQDGTFMLGLQGLAPDWFTLNTPSVFVPAGRTAEGTIRLHPPRLSSSIATNYAYVISAAPQGRERESVALVGTLEVYSFYAFQSRVAMEGSSVFITISNEGNSPRYYVIELRDRLNVLLIAPTRVRTLITPGASFRQEIRVQPKKRSLVGMSQYYPIEVTIRSDGLRVQKSVFDYLTYPKISWLVLLFSAATIAIVLLAVVLLTKT